MRMMQLIDPCWLLGFNASRIDDHRTKPVPQAPSHQENIDLSIVIPFFNDGDLIKRAITSCCNLLGCQLEVIVVDDGSSQDLNSFLAGIVPSPERLRVFRQHNQGLSVARNTGIEVASGEYLLFLDADDELLPCDLASLIARGNDMIRLGYTDVSQTGEETILCHSAEETSGARYLSMSLRNKSFAPASWAYLYRRRWLQDSNVRFRPSLLHEDNLFTIEALLQSSLSSASEVNVYRYIRRDGSIVTKKTCEHILRRIDSLQYIIRELSGLSKSNPEADVDLYIDKLMDYMREISLRTRSRKGRFKVLQAYVGLVVSHYLTIDNIHLLPGRIKRAIELVKPVITTRHLSVQTD